MYYVTENRLRQRTINTGLAEQLSAWPSPGASAHTVFPPPQSGSPRGRSLLLTCTHSHHVSWVLPQEPQPWAPRLQYGHPKSHLPTTINLPKAHGVHNNPSPSLSMAPHCPRTNTARLGIPGFPHFPSHSLHLTS